MGRSSHSGNEPDRRNRKPEDWFPQYPDSSEVDESEGSANTADVSDDWIASLRDLELTWNRATHTGEQRSAWSNAEWLQSLSDELETRVEAGEGGGTATADSPEPGTWLRTLPDEDPAFDVDQLPAASPAEAGDWINAVSDATPSPSPSAAGPPAEPLTTSVDTRPSAPERSRWWIAVVAAAFVLLAGGAIGLVAVVGRSGGGKPNRSAATTVASNRATTRTAGVTGTTTSAPAPTTTISSTLPPGPRSLTVQSTCGRRQCALEVRDGPRKTAQRVGNFSTGQVVQIDCYVHGDQVQDTDTGQQSDMWFRYAGTNNYSSALYLQGPPVPSC